VALSDVTERTNDVGPDLDLHAPDDARNGAGTLLKNSVTRSVPTRAWCSSRNDGCGENIT
jgi:hypothetical protein